MTVIGHRILREFRTCTLKHVCGEIDLAACFQGPPAASIRPEASHFSTTKPPTPLFEHPGVIPLGRKARFAMYVASGALR